MTATDVPTQYPSIGHYKRALANAPVAFTDRRFQEATYPRTGDGQVESGGSGSFAVVFRATVEDSPQALRFFLRKVESSKARYEAIAEHLRGAKLDDLAAPCTWHDNAIKVRGTTWPMIAMEWVDGRSLDRYIDFLVQQRDTHELRKLARVFRSVVARLQDADFAHGDLQLGNVMMAQDGLRLVDFDGSWTPSIASDRKPYEQGHPDFQHPARTWGRWMDTFPALVIHTGLLALAADLSLSDLNNDNGNLLFVAADFRDPKAPIWARLALLRDPELRASLAQLQALCRASGAPARGLAAVLGPDATTGSSTAGTRTTVTRTTGTRATGTGSYWSQRTKTGTGAAGTGKDVLRRPPAKTGSTRSTQTPDPTKGPRRSTSTDRRWHTGQECGAGKAGTASTSTATTTGSGSTGRTVRRGRRLGDLAWLVAKVVLFGAIVFWQLDRNDILPQALDPGFFGESPPTAISQPAVSPEAASARVATRAAPEPRATRPSPPPDPRMVELFPDLRSTQLACAPGQVDGATLISHACRAQGLVVGGATITYSKTLLSAMSPALVRQYPRGVQTGGWSRGGTYMGPLYSGLTTAGDTKVARGRTNGEPYAFIIVGPPGAVDTALARIQRSG